MIGWSFVAVSLHVVAAWTGSYRLRVHGCHVCGETDMTTSHIFCCFDSVASSCLTARGRVWPVFGMGQQTPSLNRAKNIYITFFFFCLLFLSSFVFPIFFWFLLLRLLGELEPNWKQNETELLSTSPLSLRSVCTPLFLSLKAFYIRRFLLYCPF